jgi:hypothetical protein
MHRHKEKLTCEVIGITDNVIALQILQRFLYSFVCAGNIDRVHILCFLKTFSVSLNVHGILTKYNFPLI